MNKYLVSEAAKVDLKNIYKYGFIKFGEQQAERYFDGLILSFEKIAKHPYSYQETPELGDKYRRFVYFSDSIYYRVKSEHVEIMAIIGRQEFRNR